MSGARRMSRHGWRLAFLLAVLPVLLPAHPRQAVAQTIQNQATGSSNGVTLDPTLARVSLTRNAVAGVASVAEIAPVQVAAWTTGAGFTLDVLPTIGAGDPAVTRLTVTAPAGYTNLSTVSVSVAGVPLASTCPTPGPGQYCATVSGTTITVDLGDPVTTSPTPIRVCFAADVPGVTGTADFQAAIVSAGGATPSVAGNADGDPSDANTLTVQVRATSDAGRSEVRVDPAVVLADGAAYSTVTTTLYDGAGRPVVGKTITLSSSRGALDTFDQPASPTDAAGVAVGRVRSTTPGAARITAFDATDTVTIAMQPDVAFTRGTVLDLNKSADRTEATTGAVVSYLVVVRNTTAQPVLNAWIDDTPSAGFKYVAGSATLDGARIADPVAGATLSFPLDSLPGLADANGNGTADRGEPGYAELRYRMVVGATATPGRHDNVVVAHDACPTCVISEPASATVTVTADPLFQDGTIIGRVFEDADRDGRQAPGESGLADVMVGLDDGTYALTDAHGLYHFTAVRPGQRMVKINTGTLPVAGRVMPREAQIVTVSPGLLARVNFAVAAETDTEHVGAPGIPGLQIASDGRMLPVDVRGSVEEPSLVVNGRATPVGSASIELRAKGVDDVLDAGGPQLERPLAFATRIDRPGAVRGWDLVIYDGEGAPLETVHGKGAPPNPIRWDGVIEGQRRLAAGRIYQYALEVEYRDGSRASSPRRLYGVNRRQVVSVRIGGGAADSFTLDPEALQELAKLGRWLRANPGEQVVVEGGAGGGTADVGGAQLPVETVARHLVENEQVPATQIVVRTGPENGTVEVKTPTLGRARARLKEGYRAVPFVRINDDSLGVDPDGRFAHVVADSGGGTIRVVMRGAGGQTADRTVAIPRLEITRPRGEVELRYAEAREGYRILATDATGVGHPTLMAGDATVGGQPVAECPLQGRTDAGNHVLLDGKPLDVGPDGTFSATLPVAFGSNTFGIAVRAPSGYTRLANVSVEVRERDDRGARIMAVAPVPALTVYLPPRGETLASRRLRIAGETAAENYVVVNGDTVAVGADGGFATITTLPEGKSRIVVEAVDPTGAVATVARDVEVDSRRLYLLAFADGVFGKLQGGGYVEDRGVERQSGYYAEGRVAYYLKGWIAGRYLITSSFDSQQRDFRNFFSGLNAGERDRLFTNIDPDRYYPIYGDSSTTVYDAPGDGRFYLGVEGEEMRLTVGSTMLSLDGAGADLAGFRRSLYGGRFHYQSASKTRFGDPNTVVTLIGAEVRHKHVRDELRGTGGSVYYLSQNPVVEGSEQVELEIRDRSTGLTLARIPQRRGTDYTIKYEEARLLFQHPITSTAVDGELVSQALLAGNPVFVEVDYEIEATGLEKSAVAGQLRRQVGDHLGLGATWAQDEQGLGRYEMSGVNGEIRLSQGSRLSGEFATSRGVTTATYTSDDGGLSYTAAPAHDAGDGRAVAARAEVDPAEWLGWKHAPSFGGYYRRVEDGFYSVTSATDRGTQKLGGHGAIGLGAAGNLALRYDREEALDPAGGSVARTQQASALWTRDWPRWGVAGEYQKRGAPDSLGPAFGSGSFGAGRIWAKPARGLTTQLEHQATVSGPRNDRSAFTIQYQVFRSLALEGTASDGTLGRSLRGGLTLGVGGGTAYLRRQVDENVTRSAATVLGAQMPVGAGSRAYVERQWQATGTGPAAQSLIGIEKLWPVAGGMQLRVSGERGEIGSGAGATRRTALAARVTYARSRFEASSHGEVRFETGASDRVQYVTTNRLSARLAGGFTALADYRRGVTRDRALDRIEARFEESSLGLAFRPIDSDRYDVLARVGRLSDLRPPDASLDPGTETTTDVAVVEGSVQLAPGVEWATKQAFRLMKDAPSGFDAVRTHSVLSISRINLDVYGPVGIGTEYRLLAQHEAGDRHAGWLNEIHWEAARRLRLAFGYNFTDFSDNEFSRNDRSVRGWFVRMQGRY